MVHWIPFIVILALFLLSIWNWDRMWEYFVFLPFHLLSELLLRVLLLLFSSSSFAAAIFFSISSHSLCVYFCSSRKETKGWNCASLARSLAPLQGNSTHFFWKGLSSSGAAASSVLPRLHFLSCLVGSRAAHTQLFKDGILSLALSVLRMLD